MQPDAMAVASLALVPVVGVVDREGAAAVEIRQLLARQAGGDVIDADRRLLVAFAELFGAQLALCDVVVGDEARRAIVIVVEIEPGFLTVADTRRRDACAPAR